VKKGGPARPEKNKIYPIKVDLWSTALVFNAGHKIEVLVQSTNSPRFDVHSNTWEPVDGRSKIVLPVTKIYSRDVSGAAAQ
jgi:predicted acyl esterase